MIDIMTIGIGLALVFTAGWWVRELQAKEQIKNLIESREREKNFWRDLWQTRGTTIEIATRKLNELVEANRRLRQENETLTRQQPVRNSNGKFARKQ